MKSEQKREIAKKKSESRTKQSKQSELVSETWLKLNIQSDPIAFHFETKKTVQTIEL